MGAVASGAVGGALRRAGRDLLGRDPVKPGACVPQDREWVACAGAIVRPWRQRNGDTHRPHRDVTFGDWRRPSGLPEMRMTSRPRGRREEFGDLLRKSRAEYRRGGLVESVTSPGSSVLRVVFFAAGVHPSRQLHTNFHEPVSLDVSCLLARGCAELISVGPAGEFLCTSAPDVLNGAFPAGPGGSGAPGIG